MTTFRLHSLSLLLAFLLTLGMLSPIPSATAAEVSAPSKLSQSIISISLHDEEESLSAQADTKVYTKTADVGKLFRSAMEARKSKLSVSYKTACSFGSTKDNQKLVKKEEELLTELTSQFLEYATLHTGVPTQGDYLRWQYQNCTIDGTGELSSDRKSITYKVTYTMNYYTTAKQEEAVTKKVNEVLASLKLDGKDHYQTVLAIYDYICTHVTYDTAHQKKDAAAGAGKCVNYLSHTAYAALINGKSVCQGYANLLYRMVLETGIDCRLLTSESMAHGWNLVEIYGRYYQLDPTWDADLKQKSSDYKYFLCGSGDFTKHRTADEYQYADFATQYHLSASRYVYDLENLGYIAVTAENLSVSLPTTTYSYTGSAIQPATTVQVNGTILTQDQDYRIIYENNTNVGTASLILHFIGRYRSNTDFEGNFTITAANISSASVKLSKTSYAYDGKNKKPTVSVTLGKNTISSNYYTVTYSSNQKVGTASVTVTGKGVLTGTKKLTFSINPAAPSLSSVKKASSGKLTVKWKKVSGVDGYRIQYSTSSKFSNAKTVTVKKSQTVSAKLSKLTKNKTYYVRVQSYQKSGKTTYYSAWSKTLKAKA